MSNTLLKIYHCFQKMKREGFNKALSQKTCQAINHIQLSGEEHGMNHSLLELFHFYYFPKAVTQKK